MFFQFNGTTMNVVTRNYSGHVTTLQRLTSLFPGSLNLYLRLSVLLKNTFGIRIFR